MKHGESLITGSQGAAGVFSTAAVLPPVVAPEGGLGECEAGEVHLDKRTNVLIYLRNVVAWHIRTAYLSRIIS